MTASIVVFGASSNSPELSYCATVQSNSILRLVLLLQSHVCHIWPLMVISPQYDNGKRTKRKLMLTSSQSDTQSHSCHKMTQNHILNAFVHCDISYFLPFNHTSHPYRRRRNIRLKHWLQPHMKIKKTEHLTPFLLVSRVPPLLHLHGGCHQFPAMLQADWEFCKLTFCRSKGTNSKPSCLGLRFLSSFRSCLANS